MSKPLNIDLNELNKDAIEKERLNNENIIKANSGLSLSHNGLIQDILLRLGIVPHLMLEFIQTIQQMYTALLHTILCLVNMQVMVCIVIAKILDHNVYGMALVATT
jgi:hypothetical protein